MNRDKDEDIRTFPLEKDEIAQLANKYVIINVNWFNRPLFGTILDVGPSFLTLSRKNGKIIKIRRSAILAIEEGSQ